MKRLHPDTVAQAAAKELALASFRDEGSFRDVAARPDSTARPHVVVVGVSRIPEAQAATALPPPMTAEGSMAQAEAEGLTLARSDKQSGFRNVSVDLDCKTRPYQAKVRRDGKKVHLGCFTTAEEAALHVARTPEGQAAAAAALSPSMTAAEAMVQAEAEGLTLVRADMPSGFRNVYMHPRNLVRPFEPKVTRDGKQVYLGYFATAEEAALCVARTPEAKANIMEAEARAAAAKASAVETKAKAEAKAQARVEAKLAAKVEAARVKQEHTRFLEQHRQQLEQRRQQMAAQQAQMLRAAAERQRQRKAGVTPAAAATSTPPAPSTAAAEPTSGSTDELIQQVLRGGSCPFRCLGLERSASQEGVRKRYLALALRLHPDKIQHTQAHEAFAALEPAYSRARDAAADAAASTPWTGVS